MIAWTATHRITVTYHAGGVEGILVMLHEGCGYTAAEWASETAADWERTPDGVWSFQGNPAPDGVTDVVVEDLRKKAREKVTGQAHRECFKCGHLFPVDVDHVSISAKFHKYDDGAVELDIEIDVFCDRCGEEVESGAWLPQFNLQPTT